MFTASIQELMEHAREMEARAAGTSENDIRASRQCGIDARDVQTLRDYAGERELLIIVRCPKTTARAWHGIFPGKNIATKEKTGDSGVVVKSGRHGTRIMVSDYDLMSVWKREGKGYEKVAITALKPGAPRGKWSPVAVDLIRGLNRVLVTRIQHGCQDDWRSASNPGVKPGDHFAAFEREQYFYLPNPAACGAFYRSRGLSWPYDGSGRFVPVPA